MEEPVTDGDDYASHLQLALVDVVNPISHSISSSSSVTHLSPNPSTFSPNDGSPFQKVPGSEHIRSNTETPTDIISTSKFTLPKDWSVHKVHRKYGGTTDKYYRDPESGLQFRSLKEVERYITEGVTPTKSRPKKSNNHQEKNSASREMIVVNEKIPSQDLTVTNENVSSKNNNQYQLATMSPTNASSPFELPYGWVVKEVPRISGDYADKYYYEPGTGKRFRSLVAVQKHLSDIEENSPLSVALEEIRENNLPISKAFKLSTTIKNHGSYSSWKKSVISRKEKTTSFDSPPSKINWVISGSGGDTWNAFVDDTLVQDSVKQQWGDTFMMAIANGKHNAPVSG